MQKGLEGLGSQVKEDREWQEPFSLTPHTHNPLQTGTQPGYKNSERQLLLAYDYTPVHSSLRPSVNISVRRCRTRKQVASQGMSSRYHELPSKFHPLAFSLYLLDIMLSVISRLLKYSPLMFLVSLCVSF